MKIWQGDKQKVTTAQTVFYHRAKLNSLAATGKYDVSMEKEASLA